MAVVTLKHEGGYLKDGMVLRRNLKKLCAESGFGENRFDEYLQLLGRFEIAFPATANRYNSTITISQQIVTKTKPTF